MPQSTEEFKTKFNEKLTRLLGEKGLSSKHLTEVKYKCITNRASDLVLDQIQKKSSEDYRLRHRYEMLEVTVNGIKTKKLKERGTDRIYVSVDDIFDVINVEHLSA